MNNRSLVIYLFLLSSVLLYGAEEFIPKGQEIRYDCDGQFQSSYYKKEISTQLEAQQLNQLNVGIEYTAHILKKELADLIVENAHVIVAFPKERPSIKMQLKIMMNAIPDSDELSADQQFEYSRYMVKNERSQDEEIDHLQFKLKLARIAIFGCDRLMALLDDHQNIIALKENSSALGLDLDLYMHRK